jgi:5'-3' exonuclease
MCILPKESAELLPEPFRNQLLEKDSILRQPVDYYPDSFQEEQYGSLKEHEYIALIPFLDINIVNLP